MCLHECIHPKVCRCPRSQKRALDPWELGLQVSVSPLCVPTFDLQLSCEGSKDPSLTPLIMLIIELRCVVTVLSCYHLPQEEISFSHVIFFSKAECIVSSLWDTQPCKVYSQSSTETLLTVQDTVLSLHPNSPGQ